MDEDIDFVELNFGYHRDTMASAEVVFTVAYLLVAMGLIAPPTEFVSAGVTVQNILGNFLGSEQMNFIYYHIKRTSATLIFHSLLPLGYYVGMCLFSERLDLLHPWEISLQWQILLIVGILLPLCAIAVVLFWYTKKWSNHPIAKTLQKHAPEQSSWHSVASAINIEFRRIDKFTSGLPGRRIIVSDSWVMKTSTYNVHIAQQSNVFLTLEGTDEHELSHEGLPGVQYINIKINSTHESVKSFMIRLNAMEYGDLKEKLQAPVRNARNIVIRQSLSERFVDAFTQQVNMNPVYRKPLEMELEACIGCMQTTSDVKLVKHCEDPEAGECVQCYCRPMWCLSCMGKWFGSRQNQQEPETWMSSRAPCPTCRATFCLLDVCRIVNP